MYVCLSLQDATYRHRQVFKTRINILERGTVYNIMYSLLVVPAVHAVIAFSYDLT